MAIIYLRSTDGDDGSDGSTWALAKATLAAALTAAGAGGTVFVSQAHAESQNSSMTLTSSGTAGSPTLVLCVNDGAEPPTALATTATVSTGAGAYTITFSGFAYYYGVSFQAGVGGNSALSISTGSTSPVGTVFDNCIIYLASTGACYLYLTAAVSPNNDDAVTSLLNTTIRFGATTHYIRPGHGRLKWLGGSISAAGSAPATLIQFSSGVSSYMQISGVDLSKVTGNLVLASGANAAEIYIQNCKLGAGVAVISGTIAGQGGMNVFLENCDSSDTNYRMEHYKYEGSILAESHVVKTDGATDGTTQLSHKMTSLAGASLLTPLEGPEIVAWNDTIGAVTVTVDFVHDQAANLKDDEIWLQVEYPGTAALPQSLFATDFHAHKNTSLINWPTAAGDDQAASAAVWPNADDHLGTPIYQKLGVTVTTEDKGPIRARVMLAKPSISIYYDPLLVIT